MSGVVAIDYIQNETLTSRLTANYNLTQAVGPQTYNVVDTVANGIQAQSDAFNVNSIGSHLSLHRMALTINLAVPYNNVGAVGATTTVGNGVSFLRYPLIWCPYADWLDQDCINKMVSWFETAGAFSYKSNDQVYRNPDTREIITHSYNKDQCDKYGLFRSPYSCAANLTSVGATPWRSVDWNVNIVGDIATSAIDFQRYGKVNHDNWIFQQNLKTKPQVTVTNLIATTTTSPPALIASTDAYGNIIACYASSGLPYQGTFSCTVNFAINLSLADKLIDSIYRSDVGQSIRVNNKQVTFTFYYNQFYTNGWLVKSARAFTGSYGFGMAVKSSNTSSVLRVYGFTTDLPDNGLFTKPYYDWANQRQQNFTLVSGSVPFKIELPQLNVLPSQVLVYASPQIWDGGNSQAVQALLTSAGLNQSNIGHNIFGLLSNIQVQIDNEIVSTSLDDAYFRRETARQNMSSDGTFDETLYSKLTENYAQIVIPTTSGVQDIMSVTGGVSYLLIDLSKLCLNTNVPLVRNDRPKNLIISGTISLDPTTLAGVTDGNTINAFNSLQMSLFCYELKPSVMRLDPNTNTITNDYMTAESQAMSTLDVQNQMAVMTEKLGVPTVNFSERLGSGLGGSFFDSLKKWVLPILKPIISMGFKKVADNMRSNTEWNANNAWMPNVAPVFDAFGTFVGSGKGGKMRRPLLH